MTLRRKNSGIKQGKRMTLLPCCCFVLCFGFFASISYAGGMPDQEPRQISINDTAHTSETDSLAVTGMLEDGFALDVVTGVTIDTTAEVSGLDNEQKKSVDDMTAEEELSAGLADDGIEKARLKIGEDGKTKIAELDLGDLGAGAIKKVKKDTGRTELSLASAVLFALYENPDVDIAKERANQAVFAIDEATAPLYPQLEMNITVGHEYNNPAAGVEEGAALANETYEVQFLSRQKVFDGGLLRETISEKMSKLDSAYIQTDIETERVISDTVKNYLNILRFQYTIKNNRDLVRVLDKVLKTVSLMERLGDASQAKVDYVKARMAFAKTSLTDSVSALHDGVSNLESLTGTLPPFFVTYPNALNVGLYNLEEYIDFASKQSNQMLLHASDRAALLHKMNAHKGKRFPTLDFKVEATQKVDDGGLSGKVREVKGYLDLNYKIYDGGGRKAIARGLASQMNEQKIRKRKLIKELTRDVKKAHNQLTSIQQSLLVKEEEIESSISLQKLNRENYEFGTIDIIELIEGEERITAAYAKKYELISDYYFNMHRLMLAVGLLKKGYFCASC